MDNLIIPVSDQEILNKIYNEYTYFAVSRELWDQCLSNRDKILVLKEYLDLKPNDIGLRDVIRQIIMFHLKRK